MITLYKRIEKSNENPFGIQEIENIEELNKPILLSISAQDNVDRSIFGTIRSGAIAARVNTSKDETARFKIEEMPVDFIGFRFKKDEENKENYQELAEDVLYPLLTGGELMNTKEKLQKNARKINIMTYCNGTETYKNAEIVLKERLEQDGYSKEDIKDILSQISLTAIATIVETDSINATTTTLIDINDDEICPPELKDTVKKILNKRKTNRIYGNLDNPDHIVYYYNGDGNHSLNHYFNPENPIKPIICSLVSTFLENSVENTQTEILMPISIDTILKQLTIYSDETKTPEELIRDLSQKLSYNEAPKYTLEEALMRKEIDTLLKKVSDLSTRLEAAETQYEKSNQTVNELVTNIRKFSSPTGYMQILNNISGWQTTIDQNALKQPSDKEVREEWEKSNQITTNRTK